MLCRLTKLTRQPLADLQICLSSFDVTSLHKRQVAVRVGLESELSVPGSLRHLEKLVGHSQSLVDVSQQPDGGRSSAQRVRQRGSITQASGDLDGLPAVSISPFRVRVVSESAGQPGQDASAQSGFLGPHGRESFLKQGSQGPVTSCPSPYEATAVSEGGLGKQLGDPQVSRALGSMKEGLLRARSVAGSDERVAQGKEKRTSQLLIGGPLQVEGLEGHAVQPNGFLVREEPDSAVAGCPCVSNGSIHVATRRGLKEVVCQLRQV